MGTLFSANRKFKRMFVIILSIVVILAMAFPVMGNAYAQEPNPHIVASVVGDWFWTADFIPGSLSMSIYASDDVGADLLWAGSREADEWGFVLVGYDEHQVDLAPGNYLVISDGTTSKSLVLEAITLDAFDINREFMAGTAPTGRDVWVAAGPQELQTGMWVTADSVNGAWTANFDFDITEEMQPWSYAQIFDDDGDVNEADPRPLPPSSWRDDFDMDTLALGWYWKNGDSGQWNLDDVPGFLRMYASNNSTPSGNLLLRAVANGDFTIKTHMVFEPNTNFQFAGLVIWQDENNFLQLGRAFCDVEGACVGNGLYFDKILGGNFADGNFATTIDNPAEVYLRLERRSNMVRAFYSMDEGISWYELGIHWLPEDFQVNAVGLTASQDSSDLGIPADFDFFELTEGWGFLPEGFHDYDQGDVPNWACNAGGWAADPDDRAADVNIEVVVDDQTVVSLVAGEYRQDLADAGVCVDGNCSFSTSLWDLISSYEPHRVDVWAQDNSNGDWVLLSNSAKTLTCRTYDIYTFDPDAGAIKQITNLRDMQEYNPRWSPDGTKIVHDAWSTDWSSHGVYITDIKSGVSTPLTGAERGSYPTWSPNDKWIAFDRGADNDYRIFIVPPTGGAPNLVTEDAFMASWAPDSKRLAFHQQSDGAIHTIELKTGKKTLVVENGNAPAWSPDGDWIAFERDGDIWKIGVNKDGNPVGDPIQLTSSPLFEARPTWSNNNKTIAFHAGMGDDTDLWTVPAAGGAETWLNGAPIFGDYDANYSFNGRYISYSSFSPEGQAPRHWGAAFSYDAGIWAEGEHSYHLENTYSVPQTGGETTPLITFNVASDAPQYDGYVLLRGLGLRARVGDECPAIDSLIHTDQNTRFHYAWITDTPMSYVDAVAHFNSMTVKAYWDDGMSADLVRHEIFPWSSVDWAQYICSATAP